MYQYWNYEDMSKSQIRHFLTYPILEQPPSFGSYFSLVSHCSFYTIINGLLLLPTRLTRIEPGNGQKCHRLASSQESRERNGLAVLVAKMIDWDDVNFVVVVTGFKVV